MANERTTRSVPEMQRMLGIKKTDAYWLVHKDVFRKKPLKRDKFS